jgi:GTP-binding protein HflX
VKFDSNKKYENGEVLADSHRSTSNNSKFTAHPERFRSRASRGSNNSSHLSGDGAQMGSQNDEGELSGSLLDEHSDLLADENRPLSASQASVEASLEWEERESRNALRQVAGISTELKDVTEVEYRKVRLERVVLVGVWSSAQSTFARAEESLRELAALAETSGAQVLDGFLQHRSRPDPATFIGSGKAKEIARIVGSDEADTVIVNADLPPSQRRALEDIVKVKVVDRTAVILDIFAQHATSREAKAQVELAQLQYMLPRLRGWGEALSRQAGGQAAGADGGIGSRGPGETKIEMDRRRIRTRISLLKAQIAKMAPAREIKRGARRKADIPSVAIIGYTNAGKSSLMNKLTGAGELVGNALFATLDTAVRSATTRSGRAYTYVDTVGFVRDLPMQLIEAFKSTLEESSAADVIIHLVDASVAEPIEQIEAVAKILADTQGVQDIPMILVLNKLDKVDDVARTRLYELYPDAIFISVKSGEGIDELRDRIEDLLPRPRVRVQALLPFDCGGLVEVARHRGIVQLVDWRENGVFLDALVDDELASKILNVAERDSDIMDGL